MIQIQVDRWSVLHSSPTRVIPPIVFEWPQAVFFLRPCEVQDLVLDHVGLTKRCSARIQRLKYDVGIIGLAQVDHYESKTLHRFFQSTRGVIGISGFREFVEPILSLSRKIFMSLYDEGFLIAGRRRIFTHRIPKRDSVFYCRPNLKSVIRVTIEEYLTVFNERLKTLGRNGMFSIIKDIFDRMNKNLKSRQPLLAIDNGAALD